MGGRVGRKRVTLKCDINETRQTLLASEGRTGDEKSHFSSILGKTFEQSENGMGYQGRLSSLRLEQKPKPNNDLLRTLLRRSGTPEDEQKKVTALGKKQY